MITEFRGEYEFLSNFCPCTIVFDGITYHSSEAAFQAQKAKTIEERESFAELNPSEAKRRGRGIDLREDWELERVSIMERIIYQKFSQNLNLQAKLLSTKTEILIEGNYWHDNFWGECSCKKCKEGYARNHLGEILMRVRTKIQKEVEIKNF